MKCIVIGERQSEVVAWIVIRVDVDLYKYVGLFSRVGSQNQTHL